RGTAGGGSDRAPGSHAENRRGSPRNGRAIHTKRPPARLAVNRPDDARARDLRADRRRAWSSGVATMAQVILALEIVAFWPVWLWWAGRIGGEPEAAWGLMALATAVIFAWRKPA